MDDVANNDSAPVGESAFEPNNGTNRSFVGGNTLASGSFKLSEETANDNATTVILKEESRDTIVSTNFSSLQLRKAPVSSLLKSKSTYSLDTYDIWEKRELPNSAVEEGDNGKRGLFQILFLRPEFSLRKQLMSSFGSINALVTIGVVLICILSVRQTGTMVKRETESVLGEMFKKNTKETTQFLAEYLTSLLILENTVDIIQEATKDRFLGYPEESDEQVPFLDMNTNTRKYPIIGERMLFDWERDLTVTDEINNENLQGRWNYYKNRNISTAHASFIMQGVCDPDVIDTAADTFWENCTEENNNVAVGGVVNPSKTTEQIYRKGKDIVPLLKAIFESNEMIRDLGIFFVNDGAGASINYPHHRLSSKLTYKSIGCSWMHSKNPYDDSKNIGTQEMIDKCRNESETVSVRTYNPLETDWFRDQALKPDKLNIAVYKDRWNDGELLLHLGKGIYDHNTKELVGCSYIGISLSELSKKLESLDIEEEDVVSLIKLDDNGTIIASSRKNKTESIYEERIGFKEEVDFLKDCSKNDGFQACALDIPYEVDNSEGNLDIKVIFSASDKIYNEALNEVNEGVKNTVDSTIVLAASIGLGCLALVIAIILVMSYILTAPLKSMNGTANEIVNNFGDSTINGLIEDSNNLTKEGKCTPKTEISKVVNEFNKMIESFSGSSVSKGKKWDYIEMRNQFPTSPVFEELYESRRAKNFSYKVHWSREPDEQIDEGSQAENFIHIGPNQFSHESAVDHSLDKILSSKRSRFFSPIFMWTVALIVIPILLLNIVTSGSVIGVMSSEFTKCIAKTETTLLDSQLKALKIKTQLRSYYASELSSEIINQLHLITRYSEWLLFGALKKADSFTQVTTGLETCKKYSNKDECPYYEKNFVCDCKWNEVAPGNQTCTHYTNVSNYMNSSRYKQIPYFECEAQGVLENGDRNTSLDLSLSTTSDKISWWDDARKVPGWNISSSISGYDTTYDRLRSISALPLLQVLYNARSKGTIIGSFIGFEADGLFVGYEGCRTANHIEDTEWESTEGNGAFNIREELCPEGKRGYDPRCRGWYDSGKKGAEERNITLHVTAPYLTAEKKCNSEVKDCYLQSATSSLIDIRKNTYIGQVLIDFNTSRLFDAIKTPNMNDESYTILITTEEGEDTVIAPNFSLRKESKSISDVILGKNASPSHYFSQIIQKMKSGEKGEDKFFSQSEEMHICYAPVNVPTFAPKNSSDFRRGGDFSNYTIYSLAYVKGDSDIRSPFEKSLSKIGKYVMILIGILSAVIVIASLIIIHTSHLIAMSITDSMLYLLGLIQSMKSQKDGYRKVQKLETSRACNEIMLFSATIEILHSILKNANKTFYLGDFEGAFWILEDALRLFRRLDNKKAIGIACNNLGNIMLAYYESCDKNKDLNILGLTRKSIIKKGIDYFHKSISLGENLYDEYYNAAGWNPNCLDFMQHLADRYFNRGLFLLAVKNDHDNPSELEELGRRDLQIVKDMDEEVITCREDPSLGITNSVEKIFNTNLNRIRGYNMLLKLGYQDDWELKELLDETFQLIVEESRKPTSSLFEHFTVSGRMQEIETELLIYHSLIGSTEVCAKIAIRMITEDERIFSFSQNEAVRVLLKYIENFDLKNASLSSIEDELKVYQYEISDVISERNDHIRVSLTQHSSFKRFSSDHFTEDSSKTFTDDNRISKSFSLRCVTMEDF